MTDQQTPPGWWITFFKPDGSLALELSLSRDEAATIMACCQHDDNYQGEPLEIHNAFLQQFKEESDD